MAAEQPNPDVAALADEIKTEMIFGQALIRRAGGGFELRHIGDNQRDAGDLRPVSENEIRALAQFSSSGSFRPLKSAPNLPMGWRIGAQNVPALGTALNHLYPGAVADWFAARAAEPPVTSYRQFTARQTGMYRITTLLDDVTAGAMIRTCCHKDFCLKRRLWTVEELPPDELPAKSVIPCLEPCAILLEFARKVARWEQQDTPPSPSAASAKAEVGDATENANPALPPAECDFDAADNPRRLRFILEKQQAAVKPTPA